MADVIEEMKFFSKELLREANNAAHREKRRCCIDPKRLETFPLDFVYYVPSFFLSQEKWIKASYNNRQRRIELYQKLLESKEAVIRLQIEEIRRLQKKLAELEANSF